MFGILLSGIRYTRSRLDRLEYSTEPLIHSGDFFFHFGGKGGISWPWRRWWKQYRYIPDNVGLAAGLVERSVRENVIGVADKLQFFTEGILLWGMIARERRSVWAPAS